MAFSIPRFQQMAQLVDSNGNPTQTFHIWWDTVASSIEGQITDITSIIADIQTLQTQMSDRIAEITALQTDMANTIADLAAAVADIAAAQAAADAAQTTADGAVTDAAAAQSTANTANTTANTVKKTDKISGSSIIPSLVLTATDAGSNASIIISNHTRIYGDGTQVAVTGTTLTGRSYSTTYAVYYNDPTTSDTTPTFSTTTTVSNALPNFANGRHFVGLVTTPAAGGADTTGGPTPPSNDPADRDKYSSL